MVNYNHKTDWYYEGNISESVVSFLRLNGYEIVKDNSGKINERGEDIIATKNGIHLLVEVKGYPTEFHTKGTNKGQKKKTKPKLQAKHWFSEAIFTTIANYTKHKDKKIELGLGLPKHERYLELAKKIKPFFVDKKLDLKVFFVDESGKVTVDQLSD
jgi:Holliday junction resolvase-like predicted endonuclease